MALKGLRKSVSIFGSPNLTIRDATLSDVKTIEQRVRHCTTSFFGPQNLELQLRSSIYSLIIDYETGKMSTYANFNNVPNINALPKGCWLDWMNNLYGMDTMTYHNSLFLTYLIIDDPYNADILHKIYTEVYLREPKLKYIITVCPPIDSLYEEIFSVHSKRIYSVDSSVSRLSQSIYVCERYSIIPRMRLRRALPEDNDDLVEIIDEKLKVVRQQLGDFYVAELVFRNDPSETMVVAEISNVTIGMMWINSNVHRKALADNFEISAYGNFLRQQQGFENTETRTVMDLVRKRSDMFFEKFQEDVQRQKSDSSKHRMSLNNLYSSISDSIEEDEADGEKPKTLFHRWELITRNLRAPWHYVEELRKPVLMPSSTEVTNVFAIQLYGLSSTIDPRRIFDLIAGAFASYKEKDYCIISLSSSEASSDSLNGPLLRYFSRLVPRPGCKISDVIYVTHRNSFLAEIDVRHVTPEDVSDIEDLACLTGKLEKGMYALADILQRTTEYLQDPWSPYDVVIIRCGGVPIGFAILRQNCILSELQENFLLYDDDRAFAEWEMGELMYLHLHPAFLWEWVLVTREILRVTGYISMHFRLSMQHEKPVLNSILVNMFPILPRKRVEGSCSSYVDPYALYYLNIKMCHLYRIQIENKIVIIGFNEVCCGFLRTLIFSSNGKHVQCLNITVITPSPGYMEAAYDIQSFEKECSMFFNEKNQFDAVYLRQLEFRTWVNFIGAQVKGIQSVAKRILLEDGKSVRYDKLFFMCSSRYGAPKAINTVLPANYLEINGRLDKIIFHHKIRLLAREYTDHTLPILVYGIVAFAHSCVNTLIDLGIRASQICLIAPKQSEVKDFPETFADEYIVNFIYDKERAAGVTIYKDLKFVDWKLHAHENAIESVTFQSDVELIELKCLAFVCFHTEALSQRYRDLFVNPGLELANNRVIIDQSSRTNLPDIYASGRITQYQDVLFAKGVEQKYFNQIEIGNQLAMNFIHEYRTGEKISLLSTRFSKPIFRQSEQIGGILFAGLRKPGMHVPSDIRKCVQTHGIDLITCDGKGEYCRMYIEKTGFITEICCITRKYVNLEVLYRIYNIHESLLDNIRAKCDRGEIKNLLDYIHEASFSAVLHDQFILLRNTIRKKNMDHLMEFFKNKKRTHREEIQTFLREKGMEESIKKHLIAFITRNWKDLGQHYAIPGAFPK